MKIALALGLAGLIPFVGLSALITLGDSRLQAAGAVWLAQYAAIICTFIGAFQWGIALQSARIQTETLRLFYSVTPALYAWLALQLQTHDALRALAACLVVCLAVDVLLQRKHPWPFWFLRLRIVLTAVATVSLLTASL